MNSGKEIVADICEFSFEINGEDHAEYEGEYIVQKAEQYEGQDDSKSNDVSQMCRVCAESYPDLISIFSKKGKELNIIDYIHMHLPIQVTAEDLLPTNICSSCVDKLNASHNLYTLCVESDTRLKNLLGFETDQFYVNQQSDIDTETNDYSYMCEVNPCEVEGYEEIETELQLQNGDYVTNVKADSKLPGSGSKPNYYKRSQLRSKIQDNLIAKAVLGKLKPSQIEKSPNCIETTPVSSEVTVLKNCQIKIEPNHQEEDSLNLHLPSELNNLDSAVRDKIQDALQTFITSNKTKKRSVFINVVKKNSEVNSEDVKQELPLSEISDETDNFENKEENQDQNIQVKEEDASTVIVNETLEYPVKTVAETKPKESPRVKDPKIWICKKCWVIFPTQKKKIDHVKNFHGSQGPDFKCDDCAEVFSSKRQLLLHRTKHVNLDCKTCGKVFETRQALYAHGSVHQTGHECMCDICGLILKKPETFKNHRFLHGNPDGLQEYKCETCNKIFLYRHKLEEHIPTHVNEKQFLCSYCGLQFFTKKQLWNHLNTHSKQRFVCTVCNVSFSSKASLVGHAKFHVRKQGTMTQFRCRICFKVFRSRSELLFHRQSHTREELIANAKTNGKRDGSYQNIIYECEICEKKLRNNYSLQVHLLRHTGEKPYVCQCGESFRTSGGLKTHLMSHPGESVCCKHCGQQFTTPLQLIIHERKEHLPAKLFKCDKCSKEFRSKMMLIQHNLVHTSERKFVCLYCPMKFKRQFTLDAHVRIHTGERPYACNICGQGFKQKGDRNKHQAAHERKKNV